jgi:pyruvate dehydrogenase E2 component (dihydrolipoamide acetyltransferase)
MATAIKLPDLGTNVEECKVLCWRVQKGAAVKRGDILADIETDKAVAELESTAEGVLLQLVVKAGDMAHTGDILAYVGKPGEAVPAGPETLSTPAAALSHGPAAPVASPSNVEQGPSVRISSMVRNLAAKLGVDLARVVGTGSGGVITREDVQRTRRELVAPATATAPPVEHLSRAQAAVARAVQKSWKEIPHLSITASIDMTAVQEMRAKREVAGVRLSYDAIFLKAMARAAAEVPLVAAKLDGEKVVHPQGVHIALAVGLDNALHMPVVRDVAQKDIATVQIEIAELVAKVKAGTLRAEQMTGGCMALSNLGMYEIEAFDAIIFPEHSTILTVGALQAKPVVVDGEVKARPLVTVKLAADHRLINGRTAAAFLAKIKKLIEAGDLL